jgi:hypothetical protein
MTQTNCKGCSLTPRQLAGADPPNRHTPAVIDYSEAATYTPDLAMSVHNLAIRLTEVGHRQVALAPVNGGPQAHRYWVEVSGGPAGETVLDMPAKLCVQARMFPTGQGRKHRCHRRVLRRGRGPAPIRAHAGQDRCSPARVADAGGGAPSSAVRRGVTETP